MPSARCQSSGIGSSRSVGTELSNHTTALCDAWAVNSQELAAAADVNLAVSWATLGRSAGSDIADVGPLMMVATGLPLAFFNGAFLRGPTDDPEHLVNVAIQFFGDRGVPWLLWAREEVSPALLAAGRAAGLSDAGGPPVMAVTPIPPSPATPDGLRIDIAASADGVRDHTSMLRDGFGIPQDFVDRMMRPAILDEPDISVFVGRVDGEPVSCSLLTISGSTAGVYNVATPERFRGRGFGEAMTWAVLAEGARRGCTHGVLQASDAGYPIYRRMGFADLGRYVQLQGPPADPAG
jgi:GNAT superfamily N-acetyltransferase